MKVLVISKEKLFIGEYEGDTEITLSQSIKLTNALEIREMFVPTEQGTIHRMVNFVTISPFDKTPHTVTIKEVNAIVVLEEGSDSIRNYEGHIAHLRAENANIQIAPPSSLANFSGKFRPMPK
jgi:hypothetical protein